MNNTRRKAIAEIVAYLEKVDLSHPHEKIESLKDEEQEAYDNMPESLQSSERGEATQAAADQLGAAYEALDEALTALQTAIEALGEAAA